MKAIEGLENPYQRTALLLVRWSGARKGEIRRLTINCLDTYPDGYPRLRIPVGKTYTERIIPTAPPSRRGAAGADRTGQGSRCRGPLRHLGPAAGPLGVHAPRPADGQALPFRRAVEDRLPCRRGLLDARGRPTVSAHRFRHTVGTQLAEGGAQIQTIMAILGHRSASMSATYSHISDPVLREQYEKVIAAGGRVA